MKKRQFQYTCYKPLINSVENVLEQMMQISLEIKGTDFENLKAFNATYHIITQNVFKKMHTGYFHNDKKMEEIDIVFAQFYFTALKNFVNKEPVDLAWNTLFSNLISNIPFQFIYMALGINAHVNNDLPLTLLQINPDTKEENSDYNKINIVIKDSLDQVIIVLHEPSFLLNVAEDALLPVYRFFLDILIGKWRTDAWYKFQLLKKNKDHSEKVKEDAFVIAVKLRNVTDLTAVPKIFSLVV